MSKVKRLLSVLVAALMLLTLPIMTGISRAIAEGTTEPETPSEGYTLALEEADPSTLNVKKLGEEKEEEETGIFDPEDIEIEDMDRIVRVSIFLNGKSTIDQGYSINGIAKNSKATEYRNKLKKQQAEMEKKIEKEVGHDLNVKWNLTLATNAISVEIPYRDVFTIRRMEGVKMVVLETQYNPPVDAEADHPNTANTSENMVGAQAAWALGYPRCDHRHRS